MTFLPMELPPQQPTQAYVCRGCAAIVLDTGLHTEACGAAQALLAADLEAAAPTVVEVQTGDGQTVGTLEQPAPARRRGAAEVLAEGGA